MNTSILRRLLIGRFLATLADQFLLFAVPLIIYKKTGSAALSGLAFGIEWIPRVVSLPLAGLLADRLGSRIVFLVSDSLRAILCLIGFLLIKILPVEHTFILLSILSGLIAFFYAQGFIALEASLPRLLPISELPKAQSVFQGIEQVSSIGGPLIASVVVCIVPVESLLLLAGVMFTVGFCSNYGIPNMASIAKKETPVSLVENFKIAMGHIAASGKLKKLIAYTLIVNLMYGTLRAVSAPVSSGQFHMSDQYFGLLNSVAGVTTLGFLFCVPVILKRVSMEIYGALALILVFVSSFAAGFSGGFWSFTLASALLNGGDALFNVYIRTERARIIPKEDMGKTIGIIVCLNQLTVPLSGLLIARLGGIFNPQMLITLITFVSTLIAASIFLVNKSKGRLYEATHIASNSVS